MKNEKARWPMHVTSSKCKWSIALAVILGCVAPIFGQAATKRDVRNGSVVLDSTVTILVPANEPQPVRTAAEDLASDFAKVLGTKPRIVSRAEDSGAATILISEQSKLPETIESPKAGGAESFSMFVSRGTAGPNAKTVVLCGADMRGTIYAIYEFSQEYLGVDPMYYWTDHQPLRRTRVLIPAMLHKTFPAPVFKYRGFFLNDEDQLTGWAPGEKNDHTGISLAVWNKVYETILRLKGNMVVPGTWIFPNDPQVKLASERGLIVTQHHAIPLGMNVARWPKDVPYNYTTHPEILERAWKNAVASYDPHEEILWSVGLRGLSDVSYAALDPSMRGNDEALGHLISKAIVDQMSIVRAVYPNAKFVTDLWQEGARLEKEGYLKIHPEVTTVWADTGYGYLQDNGEVKAGQGAYDHVAMMNGRANQLTEMVPADRIVSELGRYIKAGATQYLLLNTSDIRPVSMTTKAVMDIAWKGLPSRSADAGHQIYRDWATREFGEKGASQIADVFEDYFKAPAHFGDPAREYGDNLYHTEARQMMQTYMIDSPLYDIPSQSPKWEPARTASFTVNGQVSKAWLDKTTAREIQQCGEAQPRWDETWEKAVRAESLVPQDRRNFYQFEVLTMITINRESNRMLFSISKAVQEGEAGQAAEARQSAAAALTSLDAIQQAETKAEYGKWKNWYRGDWLTGVYRTHEQAQIFARYLDDPLAHLPAPAFWSGWEAYYHIMHYEGDRSVDVQ